MYKKFYAVMALAALGAFAFTMYYSHNHPPSESDINAMNTISMLDAVVFGFRNGLFYGIALPFFAYWGARAPKPDNRFFHLFAAFVGLSIGIAVFMAVTGAPILSSIAYAVGEIGVFCIYYKISHRLTKVSAQ